MLLFFIIRRRRRLHGTPLVLAQPFYCVLLSLDSDPFGIDPDLTAEVE